MSRIEAPGKYPATIREVRLGESRNGAVQAEIVYDSAGGTITGWHYLTRTDGTRNERTCESLMDLGWDGDLLIDLHQLVGAECRINVQDEEDLHGERRLRVAFVDPPGGGGSAGATGPELDRLQAIFSGRPAPQQAPIADDDVPF